MKWQAVLVVCALARGAAAEPGPIEAELAKAAAAGRPLVVELGATWCAPCQSFKVHVLTEPKVIKALRDVAYLEYDIDTPAGDAAARRYHAIGVPTFLVIATDGSVSARHLGSISVEQFMGLLANARGKQATTSDLEAAAAAHPDDPAAQLALARHYRSTGQLELAIERYRAAAAFPAVAAEATAAADDLVAANDRIRAVIDQDVAFVAKYPASPLASARLARIGVSGRIDAEHFRALASKHLAMVSKLDLPNAVRAALIGGATDESLAAIHEWQVRSPDVSDAQLLDAEALQYLHECCAPSITDICRRHRHGAEAWCAAVGKNATAIIDHMRTQAQSYLRDLVDPGDHPRSLGYDDLETIDPEFGNAVALRLGEAAKPCWGVEHVSDGVSVTLVVSRYGGRPTGVAVRTILGDGEIADCLQRAVAAMDLPRPSIDLESPITIPLALKKESRVGNGVSLSFPSGALVGLANNTDRGLGVTTSGFLNGRRLGPFRLVSSWQLEIEGRHSYLGRLMVGVGILRPDGHGFSVTCGVGASKLGDTSPYGIELPLEARLRLPIGKGNLHVWFQAIDMRFAPRRDNEFAMGIGIAPPRLPLLPVPMFVGVSFEHRPPEDAATVQISYRFGGYY